MSLHDDLTAVRRRLNELVHTVDQLEQRLLEQSGSPTSDPSAVRADDLVPIPDTPYDHTLWTDSDDEGLGVRRDRRAF
jgi:hypothetical protein